MSSLLSIPTRAPISLLNRLLKEAEWARDRLSPHCGSVVEIEAGLARLRFGIDTQGLLQQAPETAQRDLLLTANLEQLPTEWMQGGLERLSHAVRIEGNAELADTLGFVIRHLEWDAEEALSGIVGDVAAHRATALLRMANTTLRQSVQRTAENLGEYLTHDSEALVSAVELDTRREQLARLRDDLARLDKRIQRLDTKPV